MSLKEYQEKRRFAETPEPKGKISKISKNRFVVQEHWASHHHFDFRLEMDGVLKSWAVPKGVPEEKGVKHLAIQVEDHPVDYINFQGEIPEGLYGAGVVKIFDKGKYKLIERAENQIIFELKGKKLKGEYSLIKFKEPNQWLLIKIN
jgi:DNA ligase D-like protein (predicted 3'-phosphoesterase)